MVLLPCCCTLFLSWTLLLFLLSEVQGDCKHPDPPPYATLKSGASNESYPAGTILKYHCIPGYEIIPEATPSITCLNNSSWSETPTFCQGKQCRPPPIENGKITSSGDLRLGEVITFTCEQGYRLIGKHSARCIVKDNIVVWDRDPPLCQIIPCHPPPEISNGSYSANHIDEYVYGSAVTYKCNAGFSLIGNASIACMIAGNGVDGEWSPAAPECKVVQCKRPKVQNGRVESIFQATYTHENIIKIGCDSGHTLVGSDFIKCGADSMWHPAVPTCVTRIFTTIHPGIFSTLPTVHPEGDKKNETSVVQCKKPEIQNGKVTPVQQASYPYDKAVTIECDHGYDLVGNNTIKCGVDNMWHPAVPTCVKGSGTTTVAIGKLTLILALLVLIV
ncbi:complement receptor type 1-like [Elgaria multicarinata webbii]|uniref:complement receptor type 1-like n=1 Tax=Elgaria multicarinata webbii TaxID=159646 RepID=UPI002FCD3F43